MMPDLAARPLIQEASQSQPTVPPRSKPQSPGRNQRQAPNQFAKAAELTQYSQPLDSQTALLRPALLCEARLGGRRRHRPVDYAHAPGQKDTILGSV